MKCGTLSNNPQLALPQSIGDQETAIRKADDGIKRCEQDLKGAHAQRNDLQNQRRQLFESQDSAQKCALRSFSHCLAVGLLSAQALLEVSTQYFYSSSTAPLPVWFSSRHRHSTSSEQS